MCQRSFQTPLACPRTGTQPLKSAPPHWQDLIGVLVVLTRRGAYAKVVVAAKVNVVVRRIVVFIDIADFFEFIIAAEIGIGLDIGLLGNILEGNRLFRLEQDRKSTRLNSSH